MASLRGSSSPDCSIFAIILHNVSIILRHNSIWWLSNPVSGTIPQNTVSWPIQYYVTIELADESKAPVVRLKEFPLADDLVCTVDARTLAATEYSWTTEGGVVQIAHDAVDKRISLRICILFNL